jgi:hypothetical protein
MLVLQTNRATSLPLHRAAFQPSNRPLYSASLRNPGGLLRRIPFFFRDPARLSKQQSGNMH